MRAAMLRALLFSAMLLTGAAGSPSQALDAAVAELEGRLARADAVHEALGLLQNALAEAAGFEGSISCDPDVASLVARARVFGQAHRDAAQSSRVSARRVEELAEGETVAPLLVGARAQTLERLAERSALEVARQRQAAAWQWTYIEQRDGIEQCDAALTETAGLPRVGRGEELSAVYVIGGGVELRSGPLPGAVVPK